MSLFPRPLLLGTFAGFLNAGLEFHAEIVAPFSTALTQRPMHGQFVLVALDDEHEAVLGRIGHVASDGRLASSSGEDFLGRAAVEGREVPDKVRERYLKYRIEIRNLGVLRQAAVGSFEFLPSHRRMPQVGAKVGFVPDDALRFLASPSWSSEQRAAHIGYLALGEFVHADSEELLDVHGWMRMRSPAAPVSFPITSLVSRRALVFARAGFGKSNLMKLLLSQLYAEPPIERVAGRSAPVGTIVFDPEGEYFWPDYRDRPGLADAPQLRDRLVVFTDRTPPSDAYGSFVAGPVRFDLRRLHPSRVAKIAFSAEKLEQVNVQVLQRISDAEWSELVVAIGAKRNADARAIIDGAVRQMRASSSTVELIVDAALENATRLVRDLHDADGSLLDDLEVALAEGRICVIDLSLMRGKAANNLAGVVLDHFFEHNQEQFTHPDSKAIPIVAVIEEAQSVLSADPNSGDSSPFVSWAKEGRKYALGSVLVTQQPGSIPFELLSQADSCFVFHLLSEGDLQTLRSANAHFSEDLLASLLNEPIPGSGLVWSSVDEKPYPLPLRVLDFASSLDGLLDARRTGAAIDTYASRLRERREAQAEVVRALAEDGAAGAAGAAGSARNGAGAADSAPDAGHADDSAPDADEAGGSAPGANGTGRAKLSKRDALIVAYADAIARAHGRRLRAGRAVRWGAVMNTQAKLLVTSGLEDDRNVAFQRVRDEGLTKAAMERVALGEEGRALEIRPGNEGQEFLLADA